MQPLALVLFSIAAVLSAVLVPNNMALIPIMVLSMARAATLALALLFWSVSGRIAWSSSRLTLFLTMAFGLAALVFGCFLIQTVREDAVPAPYRILYRVLLALLPFCFIAGALLPSRTLFLAAAAVAPVAGIMAVSTWERLNKEYVANLPETIDIRRRNEFAAARAAKFEAIPPASGLEPILEFANPIEDYALKEKTLAHIEQTPDWISKMSAMLDGEHRVNALYVLTQRVDRLPEALADRCWNTAARIAEDLTRRSSSAGPEATEKEEESLLRSVEKLGDHSAPMRARHWKEVVAVSDHFRAVHSPLNTVSVEFWVRESQFQRIPENAGIEPLLDFTAIGEHNSFRDAALARINKALDSTAILLKALDGPHRLGALNVLSQRAGQLSQAQRTQCIRTAGRIATDMIQTMRQNPANKPHVEDVRNLQSDVAFIWRTLNPVQEQDLADLSNIRDLVRSAGADWDKSNILWADGVLASSTRPTPAAGGGDPK